jgi:hypothetical protein
MEKPALLRLLTSAFDVVDGARSRRRIDRKVILLEPHQGAVHIQITTIGLDIASAPLYWRNNAFL